MSEIPKCHKCGCTDKELIHHHRNYEPEEIVMVCRSCHKYIHNRLRKEGLCNIPPDKIISMSNNSNSSKKRRYITTKKYRENHTRFNKYFDKTIATNIRVRQQLTIIDNGRLINIWTGFKVTGDVKLIYIDVD